MELAAVSTRRTGSGTFRPIGQVAAEIVADIRIRRQVEHLHHLGARAVGELLAEVSAERGIRTVVDQKLSRYAEIAPQALEVAGGDGFWPAPLHELQSDDDGS